MNRKLNEITIIGSLVVYKPDLGDLEQALRALQVAGRKVRQNFAACLKLTLVDNSDDPSWFEFLDAWLKNRLALLPDYEVTLLCSPGNIGYGRANNMVIERTESDYHFVINPDLFIEPDSLVTALRFMQRSPDVGLLVPAVFGEDGTRHYLCKRNPTLFVLFLRGFAPAWLSAYYKSALDQFEMRDRNYNEMIDGVEFPSGCFMFFRTRFLKQLKGFDPDFFMYFEDADIGRRMLRLARVIYLPDVKVVHKWTRGTHGSLRLRYITIKSALIYYRKYSHFRFGQTIVRESFGQITSSAGLEARDRSLTKGRKKNLRILVLVVYYLPSVLSSAKLIDDLAREFRGLGHEVIVVAPDETIESGSVITMEGGIQVFRVRMGEIKLASRWLRGWREMMLSSIIWRRGKAFFGQNPCDLVVYYSPTIFFGSLVARLKRLYACPSYLILRDIFPQWAVDAGILRRNSLVHRFFKQIERRNYDAANFIGVQSPANLDYFAARGLTQRYDLEVLYNWAAATGDRESCREYRNRLGLEGKVVFFYGGNIGVAQDMDNILRLAERLRHEKEAYFLLVGYGSEVPRLRALIAERGLTNTILHPPVSQEAYLDMLDEFDVGLISLDRGLKTQNFPGKMLSYMDRAKPILASINPGNDLGELLDKHNAGLVCINGDDDRFETLARRLLADRELRVRLGRNAHALLDERFSVKSAARQILSHMEEKT